MKVRTSSRQIAGLLCFSVFLCLCILEAFLRLTGWIYLSQNRSSRAIGSQYRILCVGESTTFGVGTDNPAEEGYPHQLERLLNRGFPDLKIQCFYDDTIGLNTSQLLMNFPASLDSYRPDMVVFMSGLNNWWNLNKSNILLFNRNDFVWRCSFTALGMLDELRVFKLCKWILFSNKLIRFESNFKFFDDEVNSDPVHMKDRQERVGKEMEKLEQKYDLNIFYQVAEHDMRQMIKMCLARKIRVVICSYPGPAPLELLDVQKRLAKEFGLVFIDNGAYFESLPHMERYFTLDLVHPNKDGYGLLAENIYSAIVGHGLIRSN